MTVLPILRWPDARLVQPAEPVPAITDDIRKLAEDMLETMYAAPGRGLAAPQVGVMKQLFVMDATWKEGTPKPMVFVNPRLKAHGGEVLSDEGCLSLPGITARVPRRAKARLAWTGLNGEAHGAEFEGFEALCIQHEVDHLEGIVTLLRVDPEQRAALEEAYVP